jgi:serine/threonine-protein kinase
VEEQTSVSLIVSQGVEPAVMPALIGLSAADAETRITDARLLGGDVSYEYSDTAVKDTVTGATNSEGTTIAPGTELEPDTAINLVVSAGSLPSVQGLTVEEAETALDEAGLIGVVGGDGQFSDEIAEGLVIEFRVPNNATPRPGDTVTLTVSRGPELVTIPDVIDETIADAIAVERLELEVDVRSEFPEESWDESFARVTSLEPGQGQQVPKGTVIIIRSFV